MQQLDAVQLSTAQGYVNDGTWRTDANDIPQTVCYIDTAGNQHYVNRSDGFSNYLMYAALLGHGNAAVSYGVASGSLSLSDAFALQLLLGTDHGSVYRPYSCAGSSCQHKREAYMLNGRTVETKTIYTGYGSTQKSVKYSSSYKPPTKYRNTTAPGLQSEYKSKLASAAASASKSRPSKVKLNTGSNSGSTSQRTKSNTGGYKPPKTKCCSGGETSVVPDVPCW